MTKKSERVCSVFLSAWPGWQCSVSDLIPSRYMMKMGGNAAFSFRFSFVTEGLGGNAPFFKVFLTIFSVFERQCTVFLTLFGPISRLGLGRFLGGYAPFYPRYGAISPTRNNRLPGQCSVNADAEKGSAPRACPA